MTKLSALLMMILLLTACTQTDDGPSDAKLQLLEQRLTSLENKAATVDLFLLEQVKFNAATLRVVNNHEKSVGYLNGAVNNHTRSLEHLSRAIVTPLTNTTTTELTNTTTDEAIGTISAEAKKKWEATLRELSDSQFDSQLPKLPPDQNR